MSNAADTVGVPGGLLDVGDTRHLHSPCIGMHLIGELYWLHVAGIALSWSFRRAYNSIVLESRNLELRPRPRERSDWAADAALLSAVADPVRLELIFQLAAVDEACVCTLTTTPPVADNLLSYHLKVLRGAGVVRSERRGRWVHYQLVPGVLERLHSVLPPPQLQA